MKKLLNYFSIFAACFAENTPLQLGSFQLDAPRQLKK